MKRPYYIISPPYADSSAGLRALQTLSDRLKQRGFDVELSWVNNNIDADYIRAGVVVQPDMPGNPLLVNRVAHWNLGYYDPEKIHYPNEFVFNTGGGEALWVNVIEPEFYLPYTDPNHRNQFCFWEGKRKIDHEFLATKTWTRINHSWPRPRSELKKLLDACAGLHTTDVHTMLAVEAALRGCDVVYLGYDGAPLGSHSYVNRQTILKEHEVRRAQEKANLDHFIDITQNGSLDDLEARGTTVPLTEDKLRWIPLRRFQIQ